MSRLLITAGILWLASYTGAGGQEGMGNAYAISEQHLQHADKQQHQVKPVGKWKLDASTRANVAGIKKVLHGPPTDKDLGQLGKVLQDQTDKLIRECRMEGEAHEALHHWLEEYLKHLKQLQRPSGNRVKAYRDLQEDMEKLDADFL